MKKLGLWKDSVYEGTSRPHTCPGLDAGSEVTREDSKPSL